MAAAARIRGLDGLRAVGCALVLVYHLWPAWAPAGNLGVDVFFVVSGFLITTLLVREIERTGSIDVANFLVRRLRRLVPAVVACALSITAIAAFVGGDVLVHIGRQLVGTLTFTANWLQIGAGENYFDAQNPELFTHAWSLGVEQQFYLAWPFALLLIWTAPKRLRPWLALGIGAASAAWAAYLGGSRAYLGTDSHLYGLMVGASLAFVLSSRPSAAVDWRPRVSTGPTGARLRGILAGVSLVGLVPLAVIASDVSTWAVPWLLVGASVLTAGVIQAMTPAVLARTPGRVVVAVLEWRPMVWLGERSYSVYLWHWPLLVLAHAAWPYADRRPMAVGVLAASLLAAEASYRWVETPIRVHGFAGVLRHLKRNLVTRGLPAGAATVLVLTGSTWAVAAAPERTEVEDMLMQAQQDYTPPDPDETVTDSPGGGGESPSDDDGGQPGQGETPSSGGAETPTDSDQAGESPSGGEGSEGDPSPDPSPGETPGGEDVDVVGDSVTLAAAGAIQARLPGSQVDAEVSRSFVVELGIVRDNVVVAGATNGAIPEHQIDSLMATAGEDRCVVLVTGHGPPSATWIDGANDAIRAAQSRYPNVVVADWDAAATANPQMLASDNTHPGGEGADLYARTITEALANCP
jgi:peptidoglycan/LPS O-acetylase OafA/YrhL